MTSAAHAHRSEAIEINLSQHAEAFDLLMDGDGTEADRRKALLALLTSIWSFGYEEGLKQGARLLADAVVAKADELT